MIKPSEFELDCPYQTRPDNLLSLNWLDVPVCPVRPDVRFGEAFRMGLTTTWFEKLENILRTSLGGMIWWGIICCIHYVIWKISISNIFRKNVHILARSDFIKLKMKFHSFSHGIPRESSGLSGRDMRKIDPTVSFFGPIRKDRDHGTDWSVNLRSKYNELKWFSVKYFTRSPLFISKCISVFL